MQGEYLVVYLNRTYGIAFRQWNNSPFSLVSPLPLIEILEFWSKNSILLLPLLFHDPCVSEMKSLVFHLYKGKLLRSKEDQEKHNRSVIHF